MSFLFSLVLLNSCPYIYIRNFSYPSLNLHPFLILKMFNFKLNYFTIQWLQLTEGCVRKCESNEVLSTSRESLTHKRKIKISIIIEISFTFSFNEWKLRETLRRIEIFLFSNLSMQTHIQRSCRKCINSLIGLTFGCEYVFQGFTCSVLNTPVR